MASPVLSYRRQTKRTLRGRTGINQKVNFSKIGGLSHHIKLLREIIILPLLYGDVYEHFNIKPPRGVIFYGPPGTGKTLVAAALATEMNNEGGGRVTFFHRKGADILDKWLGESERKLREIFDKAKKSRPSIIFFDELDGLAPERSNRNDQIHSSIVATLLAQMDGLDDSSGVVVIGATNRIETIDPALRRPGRFDRELYFPLPNLSARREIFTVHTRTWMHKPNNDLISKLAEATSGCCGSDLQAICAEAVLCCVKRRYPGIGTHSKMDIDLDSLRITEEDFLQARANITPNLQRLGACKMRKLTAFIKPLLQAQLNKILHHIEVLLPHFLLCDKKYIIGAERYAGRLILKANPQQGLNTHIVPALLQKLEHIQSFVLDMPENHTDRIKNALKNLPAVLVLSRVDDWWDHLDNNGQMSITSMLNEMHAGLPILLIVTFTDELPMPLHTHFVYNSSIFIEMENPTEQEREEFFKPLFYGNQGVSLSRLLHGEISSPKCECVVQTPKTNKNSMISRKGSIDKNAKFDKSSIPWYKNYSKRFLRPHNKAVRTGTLQNVYTTTICELMHAQKASTKDRDVERSAPRSMQSTQTNCYSPAANKLLRSKPASSSDDTKIYKLWKQVSLVVSKDLPVVNLELMYDALLACIFVNTNNFAGALKGLQTTIQNFESSLNSAGLSSPH